LSGRRTGFSTPPRPRRILNLWGEPLRRPRDPEACGLRHLAFAVADLDAAVSHLQKHGVAVEPVRVDEHTGKRFTFFADPDGLPLELYER
jgi:glyoxylase I family protein